MKLMKLVALLVILCGQVFCISYAQAKNKLVFSTIEGSVNAEVSSLVMIEAYKRLGFEIEIMPLPGKRTLAISNSGQVDGELFRLKGINKKWPNLIPVSVPINFMEGVVITKGMSFNVGRWESLRPYKIGIRRGIRFTETGTKGMSREIADSNASLFKMLEYGRVETIVVTRSNGLKMMKSPDFSGFKMLEPSVETYPLFHYLHVKHKELIPRVKAVLQGMQKEGLFQKIRNQVLHDLK